MTLSTFIYLVVCVLLYVLGPRMRVARDDAIRRGRFKRRCIACGVWGAFLMYPQVSETTLLIFACEPLEASTSWLMADYRIQCWTPKHLTYVAVGCFWVVVFPLGVPMALLLTLRRFRVPELAAWKRDCAWLRAIVHRSMVLGLKAPTLHDAETVTTDSITIEHLRQLHRLFITDKQQRSAMASRRSSLRNIAALPALESAPAAAAQQEQRVPRRDDERAVAPSKLAQLLRRLRKRFSGGGKRGSSSKSMARSSSVPVLFWRSERELLLMQLLAWAKHSRSHVAQPRDSMMQWRSQAEWQALQKARAYLGPRDIAERAAFQKCRFVFVDYVRACGRA